jgi:hypothetical protein
MSDYKSLSTANLPDPAIDPAAGKEPADYFNTVLYTGNGSTQSITGVGFQPDMVWAKSRSNAYNHSVHDVVRGVNNRINTNLSGQEYSDGAISSFDSDGFSFDRAGGINVNTATYVAWNWKAGGTAVSNTDGSITSSVSANITSGMSLVGFTGTGSDATVGHGLDQKPEMFWIKNRDRSSQWSVYHKELGATKFVELSTNAAAASDEPTFNNTEPTATVFSVGAGSNGTNASGEDLIAWCFHSVDGFSKIGHYTGNGSTNGPFVYTGFRPAFMMIKRTDGASDWQIGDTARDLYNLAEKSLQPNQSYAEGTVFDSDFLSNGFKLRNSGNGMNASGGTYIYMAFAENPFKYSNAR